MDDLGQPGDRIGLELAHNTAEAQLMGRAAAELGGAALVLFDASEGDPQQIEAGTAAYREEAQRLSDLADRVRSLERPSAPIPEIWGESANRVLRAGGLVVRVTIPADYRGPSVWTVMKKLTEEDQARAQAETGEQ